MWLRFNRGMSTPIPPSFPLPAPPPATSVIDDLPCRTCGYNLRTLPTDGVCPECGTVVAKSICGDLIKFSDPKWVRKIARGIRFVQMGFPFVFIGIMFHGDDFLGPGVQIHLPVAPPIAIAGIFLIALGFRLITEPDPSGVGEAEYGTVRKITRMVLLVWIAEGLLNFSSIFMTLPPAAGLVLRVAIGDPIGIAGIVGLFAPLSYLAHLAARIPDPRLSARTNFLKFAVPISSSVCRIMWIVLMRMSFYRVRGPASSSFMTVLWITEIMIFVSAVPEFMCINAIRKFQRIFAEQAVIAEQNWAAHAPVNGSA